MQHIKLSIDKAFGFVSEQAVAGYKSKVAEANAALHNGTGKGNDFLGWLNLPSSIDEAHLADVENTAKILRDNCETLVSIHPDKVTFFIIPIIFIRVILQRLFPVSFLEFVRYGIPVYFKDLIKISLRHNLVLTSDNNFGKTYDPSVQEISFENFINNFTFLVRICSGDIGDCLMKIGIK